MRIQALASGSAGNCYVVDDGKTRLMIEAGIPWKKIEEATNYDTKSISACLISHCHGDHSKSAVNALENAMDIYTSIGTAEALGIMAHHRSHVLLSGLRPEDATIIGTFEVNAFDVEHDAPEPLGFLIYSEYTGERIVYVTDTAILPYRFHGVTHWMIEANYCKERMLQNICDGIIDAARGTRTIKNHMAIETTLKIMQQADHECMKEVWLLHLSDDNSDAMIFKQRVQAETGVPVYIAGQKEPAWITKTDSSYTWSTASI